MKRKLALVLAMAMMVIGLPANAEAHRLTRGYAATEAWLELDDFASARVGLNDVALTDLEWYNCQRLSPHKVSCRGVVEVNWYDFDYLDSGVYNCYGRVVVRYPFWRSYVIRARVVSWWCDR